ncbi:MAG: BON domain-containing protein, partial [Rubripirellula sp.]
GNAATSSQARPIIRTRLRAASSGPRMSPAQVQQTATNHLRALPSQSRLNGVNVSMNGRTAVISGAVGSERDRRMSEMMMRLEPGVRNVENRVVVLP